MIKYKNKHNILNKNNSFNTFFLNYYFLPDEIKQWQNSIENF